MTKSMEGSGGGAGVPRPEGASRESVAVPPGLTLEELQMLNASPMAGLARSTGVAYERMSGYASSSGAMTAGSSLSRLRRRT